MSFTYTGSSMGLASIFGTYINMTNGPFPYLSAALGVPLSCSGTSCVSSLGEPDDNTITSAPNGSGSLPLHSQIYGEASIDATTTGANETRYLRTSSAKRWGSRWSTNNSGTANQSKFRCLAYVPD